MLFLTPLGMQRWVGKNKRVVVRRVSCRWGVDGLYGFGGLVAWYGVFGWVM